MRAGRCGKRLALVAGLGWAASATAQAPHAPIRAERQGVSLTVTPIARSQHLAFYAARGFAAEAIAPYAAACGFSFAFSNGGKEAFQFRLADWEAIGAGEAVRFRPPTSWEAEWARRGVTESARIAFRWAQFPADNSFEPGDWIMGMATLERPLAGPFRIVARYTDNKEGYLELSIEAVSCAAPD